MNSSTVLHGWLSDRHMKQNAVQETYIVFMPDYTAYTWLRGNHDEITAALYAPTTYRFRTKDAVDCTIEEKTLYPFDGLIDLNSLYLRRRLYLFV